MNRMAKKKKEGQTIWRELRDAGREGKERTVVGSKICMHFPLPDMLQKRKTI